jgi:hypothetical protein
MSGLGYIAVIVNGLSLWFLPRRWASISVLAVALYVPFDQVIELGPFHFTAIRLLLVVGILRVFAKGERMAYGFKIVDKVVLAWGIWLLLSSLFHTAGALMTCLGEVFSDVGIYFLFRIFIQDPGDVSRIFKVICVLFVPLALAMLGEVWYAKNFVSLLFGGSGEPFLRHGHVRSLGPFAHAITAGSVGAACLPMALFLWRENWKLALVGLASTGAVLVTSRSSGPAVTVLSILGAMLLWKVRDHMRSIRWGTLIALLVLNILMNDPVYFLIGRIDFAGGSTGWYRARLIQSALERISEWWLVGTDFTRSWMHVGNNSHTDITNQYILMGVKGGVLLVLLYVAVFVVAFAAAGREIRSRLQRDPGEAFLIWTLGSILFGHFVNLFSIGYYDQSFVFLYLVLAAIGSLQGNLAPEGSISKETLATGSVNYEPNFCPDR